jgi:hypothetical protein
MYLEAYVEEMLISLYCARLKVARMTQKVEVEIDK